MSESQSSPKMENKVLLDPYNLGLIYKLVSSVEYSANQTVIEKGSQNNSVYILFSGQLQSSLSGPKKRKVLLETFDPGSIICDLGAITQDIAPARIYASANSTIGVVKVSSTLKELFIHPILAQHVIYQLCNRSSNLLSSVINFASNDVPSRLLRALKQISAPAKNQEGFLLINDRPTHEELAQIVGTSREVVSRAFRLLSDAGEIEVSGRQVLVKI